MFSWEHPVTSFHTLTLFQFCCKCCHKEQIIKEEFALLTLGLSGAGKSKLLSKLCGENSEDIGPTKGMWYSAYFSIY